MCIRETRPLKRTLRDAQPNSPSLCGPTFASLCLCIQIQPSAKSLLPRPRRRLELLPHVRRHHAAEAGVVAAGVGAGLHSRGGSVAGAVAVVAKEGPAADDALGGESLLGVQAVRRSGGVADRALVAIDRV